MVDSAVKSIDRARTALAQPKSKLTQAEILDLADDYGFDEQEITGWDGKEAIKDHGWECTDSQLVAFARAVRAWGCSTIEPVPVAEDVPHEEILRLAAEEIGYEFTGQWFLTGGKELTLETNPLELLNFAHAILARWTRPTTEPVPVTERRPGPEDCDAEGRCWAWGDAYPWLDWKCWKPFPFRYVAVPPDVTHWLPHHALPVPGAEDGQP
jgi:hypothetical protein